MKYSNLYTENSPKGKLSFQKFEILSFPPLYTGFKFCREKVSHSLNINVTERMIENLNNISIDCGKYLNFSSNQPYQYTENKRNCTILNLTGFIYDRNNKKNVTTSKDFFEFNEKKNINDKQEIYIRFYENEKNKEENILEEELNSREDSMNEEEIDDEKSYLQISEKQNDQFYTFNIEHPSKFFFLYKNNEKETKKKMKQKKN
jgi:hypothetical protein